MRIDKARLEVILARRCTSYRALRSAVSPQTIAKVRSGEDVTPRAVGRIAQALEVDVEEIIAKEVDHG